MKKGILCKVVLSGLLIGQMNLFNTQVAFASEDTTNARLADLYTAIKQGIIDKTDGAKQQSEIFKIIELEE